MKKDKIDYFVQFILKNKNLTKSQIAVRNSLLVRDLKYIEKISTIPDDIDKIKKENKEVVRVHCPLKLKDFLMNFSRKESTLKYTTHPWDDVLNGFESFDDFTSKYISELKSNNFWKFNSEGDYSGNSLMYLCSPELYMLINNFLCSRKYDPDKFWMDNDFNKYYVGYMTEGVVKKWMDKTNNGQPFAMPLSEFGKDMFTSPEGYNLVYFENLVLLFKKRIEFRDNTFFHMVRKAFKVPDLMVNEDKLNTLKGITIYTDTMSVSGAIKLIASNIKARSENPNIEIWADSGMKNEEKVINLHILHVNSFSDSEIDSDKLMLRGRGGMIDIKEKLIGLCDFSVISRFKSNSKPGLYKIDYLYSENPKSTPKISVVNEDCRGFEYLLTFYI